MKFIAYWNGNIPPVTKLFFSSFLATQSGELELYVENCDNLNTLEYYLKSQRVKVQKISFKALCSNTVFERFDLDQQANSFDRFVVKAYKEYFHIISKVRQSSFQHKASKRLPYLKHPLMGMTQTGKSVVDLPLYGSIREKYDLTYKADIFRCLMCVLMKESFVYVDLDICFLKDFLDLYNLGDFVYEWEYQSFANNAIIFSSENGILKKNMTALIEKYDNARPWYIFSREEPLIDGLNILPCEFFDPLWKQENANFNQFFEDNSITNILSNAYAYHWHNHWKTLPKEDSCYSHLLNKFEAYLGTLP